MYPKMTSPNPPINPAAITAFELGRGVALPGRYRAFLLATNGGVPKLSAFPMQGRPQAPLDNVQSFLGIGVPDVPTDELAYAYDLYVGGFPSGIVPIANQDAGNYVCLDLREGKDKVVFWDKSHFWSTGEWREQDLYAVADSFDQFLTLLRANPY